MLKARFLGNYYDLSARKLEVKLKDRVSFRVLCDMCDSSDFPNHSILCNFRNDLEVKRKRNRKVQQLAVPRNEYQFMEKKSFYRTKF